MADAGVKKNKYILGQSEQKTISGLGEEIRIDLSLVPNPNLNAGTVYGTVTGTDGNPVSGALVKIMDSDHNPLAHTFTAEDGSYVFSPFPPGTDYHIYAIAPGYMLAEQLPFTLLAQQQIEKNFELIPDPSATLGYIAGEVLDRVTDTAIEGAVVNLYLIGEQGLETLVAITFTNEYGQYVFSELEKGNYVTRVNALGYLPSTATVTIDQDSQIANVLLYLDVDPATARGTISGIITDDSNVPVAGADVILYRVEEDGVLTPVAFTKTNNEGVYLFINVPQGNYRVKANEFVVQ